MTKSKFLMIFLLKLDACATLVTKVIRRPPAPWMNDDTRHAILVRNNVQSRLKEDRYNKPLQEDYKKKKKMVTTLIKNSINSYYNKKFHDRRGNTATTWKLIREIVPDKKNNAVLHPFDNCVDKAHEFNTYFTNEGKSTYDKTQCTLHNYDIPSAHDTNFAPCDTNHFRPQPVDVSTVILTVKALNDTSSVGAGSIPLKFIRDTLHVIALYLTCISNTSIVTGVFPVAWKHVMGANF